ncbi:PhzF family phenazine biosynthesis isomerase [Streptomyces sp. NPDC046716]|uniref:PhzF family phenazine biosynthesis protein n=1 Tax=Streptomyces sp. NPDC046716 TaxID=3157093 RepID=UPI0033E06A11
MRIRVVDAFADRPFTGNPAGVVLLDGFLDDAWLQSVALEVNHSETAFAHPLPAGMDADWNLRWFTPTTEVDLCGHATLAAAHVLFSTGRASGPIRFNTASGILSASVAPDGTITLDFPTAQLTEAEAVPELAAAIGATPEATYRTGVVGDLLVLLPDEASVRSLAPDFKALAEIAERGVVVTAPAADPSGDHDFVSRCFFPRVGVNEDPVTGSAHTALAPLWSERLGRTDLTGLQVSRRTGRVGVALRGDRTLLTGKAITVIDGELMA